MILFALALLATAPSDAAATVAPTPATAPAPAAATTTHAAVDLDKVVCHVDTETGTRLGTHKECHTKREWAQMQADNVNDLNNHSGTH